MDQLPTELVPSLRPTSSSRGERQQGESSGHKELCAVCMLLGRGICLKVLLIRIPIFRVAFFRHLPEMVSDTESDHTAPAD